MDPVDVEATYLLIDGENIDATLGLSVLDRRPTPEERPRWDRIREATEDLWHQRVRGLFFLNGTSGYLPMGFIQALHAMGYRALPLAGPDDMKVVDVGIQRTLEAIAHKGTGSVILASHDADFLPQIQELLENGHRVGIMCFKEFLSSQFHELEERGLEIIDLEYDAHAFQVQLPRIRIIDIETFDPFDYI